ncbi:MAG: LLM class F420-dependent oxidoreductase [Actinobacteria bacterium]|nr:LLM class F420-dependent oxidoreductase [Actinomycetota bacterium]
MEFGAAYFPTYDGVSPDILAQVLEQRGWDSLAFADHTHIPAGRESDPPGGGELPRKYWTSLDLFTAVTAAAVSTARLRVGTGVCLVVQRDPITTAGEVASIDRLSGGRLDFAIGAGWNREEMRNHGTDPRTRMALLRERILAMKQIWSETEASFAGEFVSFERILCEPKPVQRPHPPILIGGDGPTVLDRVVDYCDGWYPEYVGDDSIFARIDELRHRADRPMLVHLGMNAPDPRVIETARGRGVDRIVVELPAGPLGAVEPELERWEAAISEVNGESAG